MTSRESIEVDDLERGASRLPASNRASRHFSRESVRVRARTVLVSGAIFVAFLSAWTLVAHLRLVSPLVLPSPLTIVRALATVIQSPWFVSDLWATTFETVTGFTLAATVAITLGVVLSHFGRLRRVAYPYVIVFQVIPSVALAPALIIILGPGTESKIALAFTISFFVVLVSTMEGLARVPATSLALMRSLTASGRQTFWLLKLRVALPAIFAGLRSSVTLALVGALVGEFITSRAGLGRRLVEFSFAIKSDMVWALLLVIGALGLVLYGLVALVDRRVVWWRA